MLLVSHVASPTGLILPIAEIARGNRRRSIALVVDGAHATGALPLAFSALEDIDYYGGNLQNGSWAPKAPRSAGWRPGIRPACRLPLAAGNTFETVPPTGTLLGD